MEDAVVTSEGQSPIAVVLTCLDSRSSADIIFDQPIGGVFSARVAGNIVNDDILGSMEFACVLSTARLIMVIGHSSCKEDSSRNRFCSQTGTTRIKK